MKLLTIVIIVAGALAMAMKIYLHFKLLDPKHMVTDDPPGESYWKISNGIRMTGMPAFHSSLSDTQMWQVSLMLASADKLPASVNLILAQPLPSEQPVAGSTTANNAHH